MTKTKRVSLAPSPQRMFGGIEFIHRYRGTKREVDVVAKKYKEEGYHIRKTKCYTKLGERWDLWVD